MPFLSLPGRSNVMEPTSPALWRSCELSELSPMCQWWISAEYRSSFPSPSRSPQYVENVLPPMRHGWSSVPFDQYESAGAGQLVRGGATPAQSACVVCTVQ